MQIQMLFGPLLSTHIKATMNRDINTRTNLGSAFMHVSNGKWMGWTCWLRSLWPVHTDQSQIEIESRAMLINTIAVSPFPLALSDSALWVQCRVWGMKEEGRKEGQNNLLNDEYETAPDDAR
jgi:hypothetical protein